MKNSKTDLKFLQITNLHIFVKFIRWGEFSLYHSNFLKCQTRMILQQTIMSYVKKYIALARAALIHLRVLQIPIKYIYSFPAVQ